MSPPSSPPAWSPHLATQGFAIVPHVLTPTDITTLLAAIHHTTPGQLPAGRGGWRNLLDRVPAVRHLANAPRIRRLVEHVATSPQHRRVIHLEFATGHLPGGLRWEAATRPPAYW